MKVKVYKSEKFTEVMGELVHETPLEFCVLRRGLYSGYPKSEYSYREYTTSENSRNAKLEQILLNYYNGNEYTHDVIDLINDLFKGGNNESFI